ncbi:MAG TPA: hypothetical protein VIN08_16045 [Ohtaekwangia sp.]|uniref:hypothetical protein n=1 Tax=Ohtaekwangia sp. TaxID=2066019 RepID=UPI002F956B71
MKSLVASACLLLMGAFLFFGCKDPVPVVVENCYNCKQDKFYGLTVQEFMEGVARYEHTHAALVNADPYMRANHLEASRSCWYSIDTLKKFICLIEEYSKQVKVKPEQLGIRFYYAVYPSNGPKHGSQNYRSLHTLFMVPTVQQPGDSVPVDFDPRYSVQRLGNTDVKVNEDSNAKEQKDPYKKGQDQKLTYILLNDMPKDKQLFMLEFSSANAAATSGMVKNQGMLCPPTCSEVVTSTLTTASSAASGY